MRNTTYHQQHAQERGNILLTALLILVVMNLLGVGLVEASIRESRSATYRGVDTGVFHATESCTREAISWLESQTRPPENVPYTITAANLDFMLNGDESQQMLN
ncbi:MAG: pilus assembly PilX N-terminal domain-containing protein, partial [Rickettsiales bacterium]|nr:pilus assembly PilX N-terminal domain-containing protein [Rickettsiales bacterium]